MTIQESRAQEAAKWAAMYQALKCIEIGDGTITEARAMMKMANPKITQEETIIQLLAFEHLGYIEGVRHENGHILRPLAVKITEKGHEYFKRRSDCTAYDEV